MNQRLFQRVDKPSHSPAVLRCGAHECQIRSVPVLDLPRLQRFSITLKRRQRAKIEIILALCQQSERAFHESKALFHRSVKRLSPQSFFLKGLRPAFSHVVEESFYFLNA